MNTRRRITAMGAVAVLTASAVALAIPSPVQAANSLSMLGGDVSSLQRSLDLGVKYYDANGSQKHPLDILKGAGMNYARLRVWNNPASGYNNASKVAAYAKEVKVAGSEAHGRPPLLRHVGRPGQPVEAGGVGEPHHPAAAEGRLRLHLRGLHRR